MPKKYRTGNQKLLLVTKKSGNFEQISVNKILIKQKT